MDPNSSIDDNVLVWCNGNYELVYSSLRHLRRFSRSTNPKATEDHDSHKLGFLHRFWNKYKNKSLNTEDKGDLNETDSDDDVSLSDDDDLDDLFDPNNDPNLKNNLETLKKGIIQSLTTGNFNKPRLVPKRKHSVTSEQFSQYITTRFRDLLDNIDKIDEYSRVCNIDQFLCSHLLYEGLFYYGVNDSQNMAEFEIIENMLFRQVHFQLKSLLSLLSFVNKSKYRLTDTYQPSKVFPEAVELVKNLASDGLVRHLFMLLSSTMNECYKFYESKSKHTLRGGASMEGANSHLSDGNLDYDLVFRHNKLYLNTLLDVLTAYYMAFTPTQDEIRYIMSFLPHVFDLVKMFNVPEFTSSLTLLFENYSGDNVSAYYPNSLKEAFVWVSTRQFDGSCNTNFTAKVCNLLMVMLNTIIYRFDSNLKLVRLNESFVQHFKSNHKSLFYRGALETHFESKLRLEEDPMDNYGLELADRLKLHSERFDRKKLKDLQNTRAAYRDLETILDFVVYGVYMNDLDKMLEGFSNDVLESFLKYYDAFNNDSKFDTYYLQLYNKVLKLLFTPLFSDGDGLSKSWYDLMNYEVGCKRKLEDLSRLPVYDEVNTAIFREPGTTLIHLLKLLSKVYDHKDSEFLYKIYTNIAESYRSIMPNRGSMLFTQDLQNYNKDYYKYVKREQNQSDDNGGNVLGLHNRMKLDHIRLRERNEYDYIKLNSKQLDHLLLFPNRGFSWYERNSALLELVAVSCNKSKTFVETYPRLIIELLEFSVFLASFPKVAPKLAAFLNSGCCKELQFPHLFQRVVAQLRCLMRGDLDLLPKLIYEQIISRDDRIEKAETALQIFTTMPATTTTKSLNSMYVEDTSSYLKDYFKRSNILNPDAYGSGSVLYNQSLLKNEYLKDVDNYRINLKPEEEEAVNLKSKPEPKNYLARLYTFPLVNSPKEVRKALSNLGLGSSLSFGLVEFSSLIFKLVAALDPLEPHTTERDANKEDKSESNETAAQNPIRNKLLVRSSNYTYLDVLFSFLSNKHLKGTEPLVGSLLKSLASVHVADHNLCRMCLAKLSLLVKNQASTLCRRLNRYEFTNLMHCLVSVLLYLPVKQRYSFYNNSDYLLDLTKYVLAVIDYEVSKFRRDKPESEAHNSASNLCVYRAGDESELEYYNMMDTTFNFLLVVSKGPLGMVNWSRATQHLYEQVLLPGSSLAYLLVKCANEGKLTSAVSLVCNVFKRDFLVKTLHKISHFNLNKDRRCPNCNISYNQDSGYKHVHTAKPGKFTWFLNKIHLINKDKNSLARSRALLSNKDSDYDHQNKNERAGCEVCANIDFNQRPLSILLAHEAFMEALSAYSPDLRCDLVGNMSSGDSELKVKTLYILLQFINRDCKLYLSNKLLTKFKCYLYNATFRTSLSAPNPEASAFKSSVPEDQEFYHLINDIDMEASDLVMYNKLKFLTQVDFEELNSISNLRQLTTCTFKTLVTYFFSIDPEMQLKVVDEKLFLSMVNACREPWEENSWYKLYLLAIVSKLVKSGKFYRLFLVCWPTIFNEVQHLQLDTKKYNPLLHSRFAFQMDIITSYSGLLDYIYDRDNRSIHYSRLDHKSKDERLSNLDMDDLASLVDVSNLNYTLMTFNIINSFCENEMMLYNNLLNRAGKIGMNALERFWNFNSYSVYNNDMLIKLVSHHSLKYTTDHLFKSDGATGEQSFDSSDFEDYADVVEIYNNYLLTFALLFQNLIKMYEQLNFLKFEGVFDYLDGSELNYQFKFILQLSVIKRLYKHKEFNLVLNVLIKLVNYLFRIDEDNDLLKSKIYHVINYLIQVGTAETSEDAGIALGGNSLITKLLISNLSHSEGYNNILGLLFRDASRDFKLYGDLEVLGHMIGTNASHAPTEGYQDRLDRDGHVMGVDGSRMDVIYYRNRCIESVYYSIEKRQLNCTVEALKFLSSLIRGLGAFEANRVEFDTGTLDYGPAGSICVDALKKLVSKRLLVNFYACKQCILNPPLCHLCNDMLVGTLNVLQSVATLHQFSSFWFNIRVSENESLSDMFLKCNYFAPFKSSPGINLLLPSLFVIEHLLTTNSTKTRNSIITWLNQHSSVLLSHLGAEEFDEPTTSYVCCLLRVYRISFLCLLSYYRRMNDYKNNFTLILADLHCNFPLASTLPSLVPNLLRRFSNNLDSNLNWLGVLLCLQTFFPELGAFEMDLNFTSQVPIKTKAMELVNLLVDVMLKCSDKLLDYIQFYSNYNNRYTDLLTQSQNVNYNEYFRERDDFLDNLNDMLTLKVLTLDCCVILLEYILSLVKLPNTVPINSNLTEVANSKASATLKLDNSDKLRFKIEKLAKVCTTNGAFLVSHAHSRENSVEFLAPYQLEHVPSFFKQFGYTHKTLFSTLLRSLLNLDSILHSYT